MSVRMNSAQNKAFTTFFGVFTSLKSFYYSSGHVFAFKLKHAWWLVCLETTNLETLQNGLNTIKIPSMLPKTLHTGQKHLLNITTIVHSRKLGAKFEHKWEVRILRVNQ